MKLNERLKMNCVAKDQSVSREREGWEQGKGRGCLDSQIRNLTTDLEQAREQLDEEQESKSELQRQVTKLNAEVQQWRSRYESEGRFSNLIG